MTNQQEEQIRLLRAQGVGYRNIGNLVHLSRDTVRNYCKSHNLSGYNPAVKLNIRKMMEDKTVCSYCGAPLEQNHTGRPKRFCSDGCRTKWWAQNRDKIQVSPSAVYEFTCKHCAKTFIAYGNKKRIYCCHDCYVKDRYWSDLNGKDEVTKRNINESCDYEVKRLS